jgi:multiple sugar transport system substrate-binding protein
MIRLRGITWNHTRGYAPMAVTSQVFADQHPEVEIQWDRRSLWAFGEQSLDSLVQDYDLLVIDHPMIGWAAREGAFVPLDDHLDRHTGGACDGATYVGASQESYRWNGRLYAAPVDAACQVAVARPDLLRELGRDIPVTWDAVVALAHDTGRVALPLNPIDALSAFVTLSAHLGAPPAESGGDGFVRRDIGLRVIAMLRELAGLVDEDSHAANPIATLNRMATTDQVAYCPLLFGYSNYARTGYAPRLLRFADIPCVDGRPPAGSCLGGAGLAVSTSSSHVDTATEYACWVADPRTQRGEYVRAGGQPAARAAWDDPVANQLTADFFSSTRATIEASYLRPRHRGYAEFQTEVASLVRDAVLGVTPAEKVLDALDERYQRSFTEAEDRTAPRP